MKRIFIVLVAVAVFAFPLIARSHIVQVVEDNTSAFVSTVVGDVEISTATITSTGGLLFIDAQVVSVIAGASSGPDSRHHDHLVKLWRRSSTPLITPDVLLSESEVELSVRKKGEQSKASHYVKAVEDLVAGTYEYFVTLAVHPAGSPDARNRVLRIVEHN